MLTLMHWERASEDVYVFTSDRYAQVTATLIVSGSIGVLIDTLPYPKETAQIALLAKRLCPDGVRYIIYTQHQADHVFGAMYFPRAEIIAHTACRQIMIQRGFAALEATRQQSPEFELIKLKLPTVTFDSGTYALRLPNKTLEMIPTPGHTADSISVLLQEEKILFAGDTVMALPTIGEGNLTQLKASLELIGTMPLDSIVQGHGEIVLRGEIRDYIRRSINYLDHLDVRVRDMIVDKGSRDEAVQKISIESCGMQRAMLNGLVNGLHQANVAALYTQLINSKEVITRPKRIELPVEPTKSKRGRRKIEPEIELTEKPKAPRAKAKPVAKAPAKKPTRAPAKPKKTAPKTKRK